MNIHSTLVITTTMFFGSLAIASPPADDLLAGPAIDREVVTDSDLLSRRLDETGKKQKMNDRVHMKIWMSSLQSIELSSTQQEEIDLVTKELQEEQKMFQKTHGKELASMRKNHNATKKNDEVPSKESRARMIELMELSPDITSYQDRAWKLLTTDQQKDFQITYQLKIDEEIKRREERKAKSTQEMDEMSEGDLGPENLKDKIRDKDSVNRQLNIGENTAMRRIKFLRRLQQLQKD
ncbi:MAG: hypothetical protein ISR75_06165 [Phycisphaerales bacterium]|nr:hypothetical protein [Planctomycetota bacterium]MBL6998005.1 hypothetical protein [Phycisphaerales bacterium]